MPFQCITLLKGIVGKMLEHGYEEVKIQCGKRSEGKVDLIVTGMPPIRKGPLQTEIPAKEAMRTFFDEQYLVHAVGGKKQSYISPDLVVVCLDAKTLGFKQSAFFTIEADANCFEITRKARCIE